MNRHCDLLSSASLSISLSSRGALPLLRSLLQRRLARCSVGWSFAPHLRVRASLQFDFATLDVLHLLQVFSLERNSGN